MSALFLELLEGLDTLCQTGTTAPPLDSGRQTIATSFNPFEDPILSPFGLTLSDEARADLQTQRPSP